MVPIVAACSPASRCRKSIARGSGSAWMNWNIPIGKKRTIQRIISFLPADLQQFARQRLYGNWRDFAGARRPLPPDQTFIDNLTHPSRCLTEPIKRSSESRFQPFLHTRLQADG